MLPVLTILICALEGDIEHRSFVGLLLPNACAYAAVTNLMLGLRFGLFGGVLISHKFDFVVFNNAVYVADLEAASCQPHHGPASNARLSKGCN